MQDLKPSKDVATQDAPARGFSFSPSSERVAEKCGGDRGGSHDS